MSFFNGHTICGKVTDLNYLHATLVSSETMNCPGVYVPCSDMTSPENTICVHPENREEHCPITFIDVVNRLDPEATSIAINETVSNLTSQDATLPANSTIAERNNSTISDQSDNTIDATSEEEKNLIYAD